MEYTLSIAGKTAAGEVVLTAPEYLDGRLDWFSFTASSGNNLGATDSRTSLTEAFLPAPVSFRGMPSAFLGIRRRGRQFCERPGSTTRLGPPATREVRTGIQQ